MSRSVFTFSYFLWLSSTVFLSMGTALAHSPVEHEIERLTRQLAAQPDDVELLITRGELHRTARHFAAARQDLLAARRLAPERPDLELYEGILALDRGRPADAIAHLDRFLAHPRRDEASLQALSRAHDSRARALLALGRHGRAIEDLARAIAARPDAGPELYLARAEAVLAAPSEEKTIQETIQALAGLDEGIARLGPVISLENAAIELELRLGRPDRALERLDRAFAGVGRRDLWLARRGELLQAAGRVDEAKAAWTTALAAIDSLPTARRTAPATAERRTDLERKLALLGDNP